jgi:hypothetical protein
MHVTRTTGFEFEVGLNALPLLQGAAGPQRADGILGKMWQRFTGTLPFWQQEKHPLNALYKSTAQGESGPAFSTLITLCTITGALLQAGLKAGIYEGATDEIFTLLGSDRKDVQLLKTALQDAGFLIPGYRPDTFGVGLDSSTYLITPDNAAYYNNHQGLKNPFPFQQFCGIEINGPVENDAETLGKTFATMIEAIKPLGLITPKSCGIHQHIGIQDWDYRTYGNNILIHSFFDQAWRENIFPPQRRESVFCASPHAHMEPPPGFSKLVFLSNRVNGLCAEFNLYAVLGSDRITLLKKFAFEMQANQFPSGKVNETYYAIERSRLEYTLYEDVHQHGTNLRRVRYFNPSPESAYTKLTLEHRWPPSTIDPELVSFWFDLNYQMTQKSADFRTAEILYDSKTAQHVLHLQTRSGKDIYLNNSFEDLMAYLNIEPDTIAPLRQRGIDPATWGTDPAQDDKKAKNSNNGLWPQAPEPFPANQNEYEQVQDTREAVYNLVENAFSGTRPSAPSAQPTHEQDSVTATTEHLLAVQMQEIVR